jgi:hypothetical protein
MHETKVSCAAVGAEVGAVFVRASPRHTASRRGGLVVWPLATYAQSKAVRRVGVLMNGTATEATV